MEESSDVTTTTTTETNVDPGSGEPRTTEELLAQILHEQQEHRAEVAQLRSEVNAAKAPAPAPSSPSSQSAEELHAARVEEINQHSYYCPGCGRLYHYPWECFGKPESPHPPIEVVSTDELKGDDTSQHTAAPNTDGLG